jgi:uncharacterized protein (DUF2126 family)
LLTEALSILDKENGILVSPSLAICIILEKDGLPLWKNDALIAKEGNTKFTFHDAEKFATELTKYLGIDTKNVTPTYEDPIYWALEEGSYP